MSIIYHSLTRVPHAVYQDSLYIVLVEDNGVIHSLDWSYEAGLDYICSNYEHELPGIDDVQQYNDVIVFMRQFKNTSDNISLLSVKDFTPDTSLSFSIDGQFIIYNDVSFSFEKNAKDGYRITFPNVDSFIDDIGTITAHNINLGVFFKSALLHLESLDYQPSMNF